MTTEFKVENFKSLKNFEMPLGKFNVLIGPNGSGKTNVLEFFNLVKSCMSSQWTPVYPFTYWGGYKNLVWSNKDHESIHIHIKYVVDNYNVIYDSKITSSNNGKLKILEEKLHIEKYLTITRQDDKIEFSFDTSFVNNVKSVIKKEINSKRKNHKKRIENFNPEKRFTILHTDNNTSILNINNSMYESLSTSNTALLRIIEQTLSDTHEHYFLSPMIKQDTNKSLYTLAMNYLTNPNSIILLRHVNYANLRQSVPIEYSAELKEDGSGLINLLFQWFNRNQKLPDTITFALETLFPGWQIFFEVTQEANISMHIRDGKTTLTQTSIPDGFYKLLTILASIELNPRILLIDEIEASLHARIIEYIIGMLKNMESTVIITTHSPFVVDSVDIDDLILVMNTGHKSTCRKIGIPDKLKQELADKGIAVSDSWLYGEL